MKFLIRKASERSYLYEENLPIDGSYVVQHPNDETCDEALYGIEINSLEELLELKRKCGHGLVIQDNDYYEELTEYKNEITIYDGYIE